MSRFEMSYLEKKCLASSFFADSRRPIAPASIVRDAGIPVTLEEQTCFRISRLCQASFDGAAEDCSSSSTHRLALATFPYCAMEGESRVLTVLFGCLSGMVKYTRPASDSGVEDNAHVTAFLNKTNTQASFIPSAANDPK